MGLNRPFDRQFFVRSVKSTGGSISLAKGQMAVVDVTSSSENGAAIVSSFAGYPKDEKRFAIRAGRGNKEANRSFSDKGLSTATFSLNEIKKLTATAPTRTTQTMDEVVIGYDGFNADSAFKFKKGQAPFRFWLHLSGGLLQYRGGGVSEEEVLEFVKEVPGCDPYENCEDCDECEPVDCRTFVTELIETMRNREVSGGIKVSEFVDITPVFECSDNPEVDTDEITYFTLSVCDTGDDEALNLIQAQYDFPVVRINRVGSTSTYQVLATETPGDYVQTIGSILKGCSDCPEGWDEVEGGFVYAITIEDNGTNYTTQITGALASSKFVSGTLVKSGNNAGVGFYTAIYDEPITQDEISAFVSVTTNNRNTATVKLIGEKQAICENGDITETAWVAGDTCEVTTREYSIVLKDNECGDSRLAELQASYPSALNIAIATVTTIENEGTEDEEEITSEDRKACQTRYVATVITNMVCDECDPVFKDFWVSSAPKPYGQAAWYLSPGQEEINKGGNCLCGIRIKGKPFVLSGNEAIWDYVQFTETSTKIQAAAGYNNLEIREAIGHLSKADYSGKHLTRFAPRTHLMGNMRDLEKQSRVYFLGEAYRYDYLGRILRAEEAVIQDNFQQMAQIMLEVRHENYSQGLGARHSNNNLYHFYVPFGQHQPVVDLLNNLVAAAGVAPIQL
jgi:hypothetical protein